MMVTGEADEGRYEYRSGAVPPLVFHTYFVLYKVRVLVRFAIRIGARTRDGFAEVRTRIQQSVFVRHAILAAERLQAGRRQHAEMLGGSEALRRSLPTFCPLLRWKF